jgi:hypothetical protein
MLTSGVARITDLSITALQDLADQVCSHLNSRPIGFAVDKDAAGGIKATTPDLLRYGYSKNPPLQLTAPVGRFDVARSRTKIVTGFMKILWQELKEKSVVNGRRGRPHTDVSPLCVKTGQMVLIWRQRKPPLPHWQIARVVCQRGHRVLCLLSTASSHRLVTESHYNVRPLLGVDYGHSIGCTRIGYMFDHRFGDGVVRKVTVVAESDDGSLLVVAEDQTRVDWVLLETNNRRKQTGDSELSGGAC